MKIKQVCKATELTDRTIRYYIEEELISPSYTENYLGRRTYDFSQTDIDELNQIAVLRKFDFTIDEIRHVIYRTETSKYIIQSLIERTERLVKDKEKILSALSQINCDKDYTLSELAAELNKASSDIPVHTEKIKYNIPKIIFKMIIATIRTVMVWLPIIIVLYLSYSRYSAYYYPVYDIKAGLVTLAALLPSIGVLILSKTKLKWKNSAIAILLVLCILSLPVCLYGPVFTIPESRTTNIKNYRVFDGQCGLNSNAMFQDLFPSWAHYFENVKGSDGSYETVYLDARYYYRYLRIFDPTYDVYAQWPLPQDEYEKEISRVTELFEKAYENKTYNCDFTKLKKGNYNCLILYDGDEPFKKATDHYSYYIFAYNNEDKTVRYICCESIEGGLDQPYYLQLDW